MAGGESHTFFLRRTIAGRFLGAHPKRSSTTSKTILRKGRLYTSKKEPATVSGADTCSSGTASVNSLRSVPMVRRLLHQQDYVVVFFFFSGIGHYSGPGNEHAEVYERRRYRRRRLAEVVWQWWRTLTLSRARITRTTPFASNFSRALFFFFLMRYT